ncbi:hypothetical protein AC579_6549 [Pseudocercospora musae]|uniref:RING-type domain-containing protein n=1 Tax=Pseudocercospora musae TaxID=113226 RepID=A0A139I544_9PEZI|nr:hypothetical protein AC579_6549 [Pseudocercospora musae]
MAADLPTKMVFLTLLTLDIDPNFNEECPVCFDETKDATRTSCGHTFCWECIVKWAQTSDTCPMCRTKLWSADIAPPPPPAPAFVAALWRPVLFPAPVPAPAPIIAPPPPPPTPAQHEVIVIEDDDDDEDDWMQNDDFDPRADDPNDEDYVP